MSFAMINEMYKHEVFNSKSDNLIIGSSHVYQSNCFKQQHNCYSFIWSSHIFQTVNVRPLYVYLNISHTDIEVVLFTCNYLMYE